MEPTPHPVLDPTGTDIHAEAARLRAQGPAALVELPGGVQAWSVTRHDVMMRLLADPRVSKDPRRSWPAWINGEIPTDWPLISWVSVQSMFTSDGADHSRLRKLVGNAFTPRRIEALRPRIEAIVSDLNADLNAALTACPDGALVDLRASFAYPLPTRLICDLFGVPEQARAEVQRVIDAVLDTSATPEDAAANAHDLYAAMHALVDAKRTAPGDDMTSALVAAHEADGTRLTTDELVSTLILMIGAGSETAVNLIDHAVCALLSHPAQLALVQASDASWHDVIEETLRLHPPIMHLPMRYATADIGLGTGVTISEGSPILICFGAPGRDPEVQGHDPDLFDITREDKQHLAFGYGVHYCLGAPLARLEAAIALPALFSHFPTLALARPADQLPPQPSFIANGHRELPVILRPARGDS